MMIHKIIKGSYFKGTLRYVLDPEKGLMIGGTFGAHQSPSQIAHEMHEIAGDRLRKPVFHAVLNLRPGESLSDDQWSDAARFYLFLLTLVLLAQHFDRNLDFHPILGRPLLPALSFPLPLVLALATGALACLAPALRQLRLHRPTSGGIAGPRGLRPFYDRSFKSLILGVL